MPGMPGMPGLFKKDKSPSFKRKEETKGILQVLEPKGGTLYNLDTSMFPPNGWVFGKFPKWYDFDQTPIIEGGN